MSNATPDVYKNTKKKKNLENKNENCNRSSEVYCLKNLLKLLS